MLFKIGFGAVVIVWYIANGVLAANLASTRNCRYNNTAFVDDKTAQTSKLFPKKQCNYKPKPQNRFYLGTSNFEDERIIGVPLVSVAPVAAFVYEPRMKRQIRESKIVREKSDSSEDISERKEESLEESNYREESDYGDRNIHSSRREPRSYSYGKETDERKKKRNLPKYDGTSHQRSSFLSNQQPITTLEKPILEVSHLDNQGNIISPSSSDQDRSKRSAFIADSDKSIVPIISTADKHYLSDVAQRNILNSYVPMYNRLMPRKRDDNLCMPGLDRVTPMHPQPHKFQLNTKKVKPKKSSKSRHACNGKVADRLFEVNTMLFGDEKNNLPGCSTKATDKGCKKQEPSPQHGTEGCSNGKDGQLGVDNVLDIVSGSLYSPPTGSPSGFGIYSENGGMFVPLQPFGSQTQHNIPNAPSICKDSGKPNAMQDFSVDSHFDKANPVQERPCDKRYPSDSFNQLGKVEPVLSSFQVKSAKTNANNEPKQFQNNKQEIHYNQENVFSIPNVPYNKNDDLSDSNQQLFRKQNAPYARKEVSNEHNQIKNVQPVLENQRLGIPFVRNDLSDGVNHFRRVPQIFNSFQPHLNTYPFAGQEEFVERRPFKRHTKVRSVHYGNPDEEDREYNADERFELGISNQLPHNHEHFPRGEECKSNVAIQNLPVANNVDKNGYPIKNMATGITEKSLNIGLCDYPKKKMYVGDDFRINSEKQRSVLTGAANDSPFFTYRTAEEVLRIKDPLLQVNGYDEEWSPKVVPKRATVRTEYYAVGGKFAKRKCKGKIPATEASTTLPPEEFCKKTRPTQVTTQTTKRPTKPSSVPASHPDSNSETNKSFDADSQNSTQTNTLPDGGGPNPATPPQQNQISSTPIIDSSGQKPTMPNQQTMQTSTPLDNNAHTPTTNQNPEAQTNKPSEIGNQISINHQSNSDSDTNKSPNSCGLLHNSIGENGKPKAILLQPVKLNDTQQAELQSLSNNVLQCMNNKDKADAVNNIQNFVKQISQAKQASPQEESSCQGTSKISHQKEKLIDKADCGLHREFKMNTSQSASSQGTCNLQDATQKVSSQQRNSFQMNNTQVDITNAQHGNNNQLLQRVYHEFPHTQPTVDVKQLAIIKNFTAAPTPHSYVNPVKPGEVVYPEQNGKLNAESSENQSIDKNIAAGQNGSNLNNTNTVQNGSTSSQHAENVPEKNPCKPNEHPVNITDANKSSLARSTGKTRLTEEQINRRLKGIGYKAYQNDPLQQKPKSVILQAVVPNPGRKSIPHRRFSRESSDYYHSAVRGTGGRKKTRVRCGDHIAHTQKAVQPLTTEMTTKSPASCLETRKGLQPKIVAQTTRSLISCSETQKAIQQKPTAQSTKSPDSCFGVHEAIQPKPVALTTKSPTSCTKTQKAIQSKPVTHTTKSPTSCTKTQKAIQSKPVTRTTKSPTSCTKTQKAIQSKPVTHTTKSPTSCTKTQKAIQSKPVTHTTKSSTSCTKTQKAIQSKPVTHTTKSPTTRPTQKVIEQKPIAQTIKPTSSCLQTQKAILSKIVLHSTKPPANLDVQKAIQPKSETPVTTTSPVTFSFTRTEKALQSKLVAEATVAPICSQTQKAVQPIPVAQTTKSSKICSQTQKAVQPIPVAQTTKSSKICSQTQKAVQPKPVAQTTKPPENCSQTQKAVQPIPVAQTTKPPENCSQTQKAVQPIPVAQTTNPPENCSQTQKAVQPIPVAQTTKPPEICSQTQKAVQPIPVAQTTKPPENCSQTQKAVQLTVLTKDCDQSSPKSTDESNSFNSIEYLDFPELYNIHPYKKQYIPNAAKNAYSAAIKEIERERLFDETARFIIGQQYFEPDHTKDCNRERYQRHGDKRLVNLNDLLSNERGYVPSHLNVLDDDLEDAYYNLWPNSLSDSGGEPLQYPMKMSSEFAGTQSLGAEEYALPNVIEELENDPLFLDNNEENQASFSVRTRKLKSIPSSGIFDEGYNDVPDIDDGSNQRYKESMKTIPLYQRRIDLDYGDMAVEGTYHGESKNLNSEPDVRLQLDYNNNQQLDSFPQGTNGRSEIEGTENNEEENNHIQKNNPIERRQNVYNLPSENGYRVERQESNAGNNRYFVQRRIGQKIRRNRGRRLIPCVNRQTSGISDEASVHGHGKVKTHNVLPPSSYRCAMKTPGGDSATLQNQVNQPILKKAGKRSKDEDWTKLLRNKAKVKRDSPELSAQETDSPVAYATFSMLPSLDPTDSMSPYKQQKEMDGLLSPLYAGDVKYEDSKYTPPKKRMHLLGKKHEPLSKTQLQNRIDLTQLRMLKNMMKDSAINSVPSQNEVGVHPVVKMNSTPAKITPTMYQNKVAIPSEVKADNGAVEPADYSYSDADTSYSVGDFFDPEMKPLDASNNFGLPYHVLDYSDQGGNLPVLDKNINNFYDPASEQTKKNIDDIVSQWEKDRSNHIDENPLETIRGMETPGVDAPLPGYSNHPLGLGGQGNNFDSDSLGRSSINHFNVPMLNDQNNSPIVESFRNSRVQSPLLPSNKRGNINIKFRPDLVYNGNPSKTRILSPLLGVNRFPSVKSSSSNSAQEVNEVPLSLNQHNVAPYPKKYLNVNENVFYESVPSNGYYKSSSEFGSGKANARSVVAEKVMTPLVKFIPRAKNEVLKNLNNPLGKVFPLSYKKRRMAQKCRSNHTDVIDSAGQKKDDLKISVTVPVEQDYDDHPEYEKKTLAPLRSTARVDSRPTAGPVGVRRFIGNAPPLKWISDSSTVFPIFRNPLTQTAKSWYQRVPDTDDECKEDPIQEQPDPNQEQPDPNQEQLDEHPKTQISKAITRKTYSPSWPACPPHQENIRYPEALKAMFPSTSDVNKMNENNNQDPENPSMPISTGVDSRHDWENTLSQYSKPESRCNVHNPPNRKKIPAAVSPSCTLKGKSAKPPFMDNPTVISEEPIHTVDRCPTQTGGRCPTFSPSITIPKKVPTPISPIPIKPPSVSVTCTDVNHRSELNPSSLNPCSPSKSGVHTIHIVNATIKYQTVATGLSQMDINNGEIIFEDETGNRYVMQEKSLQKPEHGDKSSNNGLYLFPLANESKESTGVEENHQHIYHDGRGGYYVKQSDGVLVVPIDHGSNNEERKKCKSKEEVSSTTAQPPHVVQSTQSTTVVVITQSTIVVPVTQSTLVVPVTQSTIVVPVTQSTLVVPITQSTIVVPVTQSTLVVPITQSTIVVPITQSTLAVPSTQFTNVVTNPNVIPLPNNVKSNENKGDDEDFKDDTVSATGDAVNIVTGGVSRLIPGDQPGIVTDRQTGILTSGQTGVVTGTKTNINTGIVTDRDTAIFSNDKTSAKDSDILSNTIRRDTETSPEGETGNDSESSSVSSAATESTTLQPPGQNGGLPSSGNTGVPCTNPDDPTCICSLDGVVDDFVKIAKDNPKEFLAEVEKYKCSKYVTKLDKFTLTNEARPRTRSYRGLSMFGRRARAVSTESTAAPLINVTADVLSTDFHKFATVGSNVEMTCLSMEQIVKIGTNILTFQWLDSKKKELKAGHFQETPDGRLAIQGVTVEDEGKYTCTVGYSNPDNFEEQEKVFPHQLSVIGLPKYFVRGKLHYKVSTSCEAEDMEIWKMFMPDLMKHWFCSEQKPMCKVDIHSPLCFSDQESPSILIVSLIVHISNIFSMLPALDDRACDMACREKVEDKFVKLVHANLVKVINTPVLCRLSYRSVDYAPLADTIHVDLMEGCQAGMQLQNNFCYPCPRDSYGPEEGAFCLKCERATYQPRAGSRECKPCPNMFVGGNCLTMYESSFPTYGVLFGVIILLVVLGCLICVLMAWKKRKAQKELEKKVKEDSEKGITGEKRKSLAGDVEAPPELRRNSNNSKHSKMDIKSKNKSKGDLKEKMKSKEDLKDPNTTEESDATQPSENEPEIPPKKKKLGDRISGMFAICKKKKKKKEGEEERKGSKDLGEEGKPLMESGDETDDSLPPPVPERRSSNKTRKRHGRPKRGSREGPKPPPVDFEV